MAVTPHDLANRLDKPYSTTFHFADLNSPNELEARPQGFEPRPTGLESVMLPLHQGRLKRNQSKEKSVQSLRALSEHCFL